MKLNHIDLQVPDVQETARFFERHFGFVQKTSKTSPAIVILHGDDDVVLVLQRKKDASERYPEGFHVGFLVPDEAPVLAFQARAREEGLHVSDVDRNARGTMVYCRAPGDVVVEVSCRR